MDIGLYCDCFFAHREDFALMNQVFDKYFINTDVLSTRGLAKVAFSVDIFR